MKPLDLSNMRVVDLSQNWDIHTPGFATYDGPTIKWIKRVAFDKGRNTLFHQTSRPYPRIRQLGTGTQNFLVRH